MKEQDMEMTPIWTGKEGVPNYSINTAVPENVESKESAVISCAAKAGCTIMVLGVASMFTLLGIAVFGGKAVVLSVCGDNVLWGAGCASSLTFIGGLATVKGIAEEENITQSAVDRISQQRAEIYRSMSI